MKKLPVDPLTPAEWIVMKAVWQLGKSSAMDIHASVKNQNDWAITTVKTLLSKLVQKGFLSAQEDGRRFLYETTVPARELLQEAADSFLEKSTEDIKGQLLCYMVHKVQLSDTDIDELQSILNQYKKKQKQDT